MCVCVPLPVFAFKPRQAGSPPPVAGLWRCRSPRFLFSRGSQEHAEIGSFWRFDFGEIQSFCSHRVLRVWPDFFLPSSKDHQRRLVSRSLFLESIFCLLTQSVDVCVHVRLCVCVCFCLYACVCFCVCGCVSGCVCGCRRRANHV